MIRHCFVLVSSPCPLQNLARLRQVISAALTLAPFFLELQLVTCNYFSNSVIFSVGSGFALLSCYNFVDLHQCRRDRMYNWANWSVFLGSSCFLLGAFDLRERNSNSLKKYWKMHKKAQFCKFRHCSSSSILRKF